MDMSGFKAGLLALQDGTIYRGRSHGASKTAVGELVFNTAMTGYQEILTDPSYHRQIVTLTSPHIGNYGTNKNDAQSEKVHAFGLIARSISEIPSNWQSHQSLTDYLKEHGTPALSGIDTRSLTQKIRTEGNLKACISTEPNADADALVERARSWEGMEHVDCIAEVSTKKPYDYQSKNKLSEENSPRFRLAVLDFGVKTSILEQLHQNGFDVRVFPAHSPIASIRQYEPEALFLSNGPGDPSVAESIHRGVAELIEHYPTFGICMGHQILGHALKIPTYKLPFGHHGANHPVQSLASSQVRITSQNHNYACETKALERSKTAEITQINLNDNTVEGLRHRHLPAFGIQYHPEAAPGPHEAQDLFGEFHQEIRKIHLK